MNDLTSQTPSSTTYAFTKISGDKKHPEHEQTGQDCIATEAPLLIRYSHTQTPEKLQTIVTLLRTPTNDHDLACGFMLAEGYLQSPQQLEMVHFCQEDDAITLIGNKEINIAERPHLTHAGCGSCALQTIENLYQHLQKTIPWTPDNQLINDIINTPPTQQLFEKTGGTHAAVIFNKHGEILSSGEDIGRHNALDKAIGKLWLEDKLSEAKIVWVSGRIGFELVQKCINAGIPNLISVGATSSLSIDYAKKYNLNIYAFCRKNSFNKY